MSFVLALNIPLLEMGMGRHLSAEVTLGLDEAPNLNCEQSDCCFGKALLVAKCLAKMQSSSQTKIFNKRSFSFYGIFCNHCSVCYPR